MKKQFTKNDLQTGHIVVTKGEGNAILIGGSFKRSSYLSNGCVMSDLSEYKDDLTFEDIINLNFNIIAVYKIKNCSCDISLNTLIDCLPEDNVELIWEREKEIDWTKVPKFTRVQVRDRDDSEWSNRYFIKYGEDRHYPYKATFSGEFAYEDDYTGWEQIRIYDESDIKEEWYK